MFVPFSPDVRIDLAIVALGVTPRLEACVASLVAHRSAHDFAITCVVNPAGIDDGPEPELPDGVRLVRPSFNLGWAGGLHAARELTKGEYLVWVQEDMVVLDGWLDALVEAADTHPDGGAFGSVVTEDGAVALYNGGSAEPADQVELWNLTDPTLDALPEEPAAFDWITSKGMLARLTAWDEVGGTDPRLFPLNHVDKDYGTHLRAHGWKNYLVPNARLAHEGSTSTPSYFRFFIRPWQEPRFNARWAGPIERMSQTPGAVDHECAEWRGAGLAEVERLVGREASRMLVPAARQLEVWRRRDVAEVQGHLDAIRFSRSWRLLAPLRALRRLTAPRDTAAV